MTVVVHCLAAVGAIVLIACLVAVVRGIVYARSAEPGGRCPVCGGVVPLKPVKVKVKS